MNKKLDSFLRAALKTNASDLHITANTKPSLRIDGKLISIKTEPLSMEETSELILSSVDEEKREVLEERFELDYSYTLPTGERFRVNAYKSQGSYEAVFRSVRAQAFTLADLNVPDILYQFVKHSTGLVLVCGATSAGKTTTMGGLINYINNNREVRIITIENPIEITHPNVKAIISQREIGLDTKDFPTALRSALRQDPDVIVIGEIRDRETASIALEAAQTGHLVLSTMHAGDTGDAINRFVNLFPEADRPNVRTMFAESMRGIVAQRLCKDIDGNRIPIVEILANTMRVSEYIKGEESKPISEIIENSPTSGMQTFEDAIVKLVTLNKITPAVARNIATEESSLVLRLKKQGIAI